jgi:hypothetical protein
MNKRKLKSILIDQIQLALEDQKEIILDNVAIEATETDEDGESSAPEIDVLEEIWDDTIESLF